MALSPVTNKIQLGPHLTQGLGAGANPEIGKQASEESLEDITRILKVNTRMAFVTAGMGGGTGTGGAPVVAKICRDLGILTVGIVTTPFTYEGRKRMKQAEDGINRMREHVDTILIISNDKLRQQFGNLPFTQAFAKADDVLATAAKCITDVITTTGQINVDFADVCTVMKNGGVAILGSAAASGENRALLAVEEALNSPLLNDNDISGAKWILLNITSAPGEFEHTMDETESIQAYVQQMAGDHCDVILGMGHDPNLLDKISVTVIATGFNCNQIISEMPIRKNEPEKIIVKLGESNNQDPFKAAAPQAATNTNGMNSSLFEGTMEMPKKDSMAPKLVEMPKVATLFSTDTNSQPTTQQPNAAVEHFTLAPIVSEEPTQAQISETPKAKEPAEIQLLIKNEETVAPVAEIKFGEHILSAEEIEEKRRFEEQKRLLEERAERLRRMSFDIKGKDKTEELEAVPAYVRQKIKLDNEVNSSDNYYSAYSVGVNDKQNNKQASIQTINTFLDGKKPD